jgi:hypothetical protein
MCAIPLFWCWFWFRFGSKYPRFSMQFTAWSLHFSLVRRHSSWPSVSILLQDAVHLGFLSRFSFLGCSKRSDRRQQVCFACSYWSKFLIGPARFRPLVSRFSTAETFDPLWSPDSDLSCFLPLVLFPSRSCPWLWFSWSFARFNAALELKSPRSEVVQCVEWAPAFFLRSWSHDPVLISSLRIGSVFWFSRDSSSPLFSVAARLTTACFVPDFGYCWLLRSLRFLCRLVCGSL